MNSCKFTIKIIKTLDCCYFDTLKIILSVILEVYKCILTEFE